MLRDFVSLPLKRIALYSVLLNMIWEYAQCIVFYDIWESGFWKAPLWMWSAIVGDVLIVLGVAFVDQLFAAVSSLQPPDRRGWIALLCAGFVASVLLEWLARRPRLWSYSEWMPSVQVFGYGIGLLPVVQITTLPALSVYLATRNAERAVESRS